MDFTKEIKEAIEDAIEGRIVYQELWEINEEDCRFDSDETVSIVAEESQKEVEGSFTTETYGGVSVEVEYELTKDTEGGSYSISYQVEEI